MLTDIAGWIPAIILPVAAATQLYKILQTKSSKGVSVLTWTLFAIANVGAYAFTEKYFAVQSILAFLLTALIEVGIIVFALLYKET